MASASHVIPSPLLLHRWVGPRYGHSHLQMGRPRLRGKERLVSKVIQLWALPDLTPFLTVFGTARLARSPPSACVLAPHLTSRSWMVPVRLTL